GANDLDILRLASDQHLIEVGEDAGGRNNVRREVSADGVEVSHLDVVGVGRGSGGAADDVIAKDDVGADAFGLFEDEIAAGGGKGDDQDYRGRAYDHSERGEQRADGIGSKRLPAKTDRLPEEHARLAARLAEQLLGIGARRIVGRQFAGNVGFEE